MTPHSQPRKLLLMVLISSLAINLLFIGAIVGRALMGPSTGPLPRHLDWIVRDLDLEARRALEPELLAHAKNLRPVRRALRRAQHALRQAMIAEPLDPLALTAALKNLEQATATYQALVHEEMARILIKLEPEQRARAVNYLAQRDRRQRVERDNPGTIQAKP